MKRSLLVVSLISLVFSGAVSASSANNGVLSLMHFMSNGVVLVYTSGTRSTDLPACASSEPTRFAVDGTTAGGKVQVAGLLAAYATGKTVAIFGTGDCGVYGDTESISYFHTVD